jgi:carbonic anhydrase
MTKTGSETERLLANARRHAEEFDAGDIPVPPAKRVAVLTCMDARIDPARVLGLELGDAHVIRNAGGIVGEDAIRSLALSQHLLGTREIILIRHTGCGMLGLDDEDFAARLEAEAGERPRWRAAGLDDLEQGIREGVEAIRSSPFLPARDAVTGFVYEVETGTLREVDSPPGEA